MSTQEIPSGKYMCTLVPDAAGLVRFPITTDRQGFVAIDIKLHVWAPNAEQPFAEIVQTECIDASAPARSQATETTPYGFMTMTLKALGAESDGAIDDATENGLASEGGVMVFPGTPRPATVEVSYKAGQRGGSFPNYKVMADRAVTDDKRAAAIEAIKARKAANKPAASPFGTPIAPPAGRPFPAR